VRLAIVLSALAATGCATGVRGFETTDPSVDAGAPIDASADAPDAQAADAAPRPTPTLASSTELCKLLSDRNTSQPTANDVQHRANVLGADLGIPVDLGGTLYVFFGDTIGYGGIWGNESHPDSVGFALDSAAAIAKNPSLLCSDLRFLLVPDANAIGPTIDSTIQGDFAGAYMKAPQGHALGEYIHNPAGHGSSTFPQLPGDFEVPSGAFAHDGSIYVFYTTVTSPNALDMKGAYLAKWSAPSTSAQPGYDVLYAIDERFDGAGALRGDFINVAAAPAGNYVYLFGTGAFRASTVHLARKRLDSLATEGGIERWDDAANTWLAAGARLSRRRSSTSRDTARLPRVTSRRSIDGSSSPRNSARRRAS